MRSDLTIALSLLSAFAWAAPGLELGSKQERAVCNADNCLRAVRATSAKPFAQSATSDCSSFMRKTVTPCAATSTATTTTTITTVPTTITATSILSQTQINTVFETLISVVTTIEDTVTFIQPTEVDVTNIIVSAVTVTAAPAAGKRAADIRPLPALPTDVLKAEKRAFTTTSAAANPGSTCPATTNSPTRVPTYASACSGTVKYSSACSCAGITGGTTTLARSTVTTTSTVTATYTPTVTATAIVTTVVPVTQVQTQIVPTAFETTDATVIVPSAFTLTTNIIVPTTVVVAPPVCSSYKFMATNGARSGQYITGEHPDPNAISYGFVTFTSDPAGAATYTIRPDGTVYDDVFGWVSNGDDLYYVLQMTDRSRSVYGSAVQQLTCSLGSSSSPTAGRPLSCTEPGRSINLVYADDVGNYLLTASGNNPSYIAANIVAFPAC